MSVATVDRLETVAHLQVPSSMDPTNELFSVFQSLVLNDISPDQSLVAHEPPSPIRIPTVPPVPTVTRASSPSTDSSSSVDSAPSLSSSPANNNATPRNPVESLYIVVPSSTHPFRLSPLMGWYLLTFHNLDREEIECLRDHVEKLPEPTEGELLDFQDHLVHDGLRIESAQFMIYWIFHYREDVMTWDDVWGTCARRGRCTQENSASNEKAEAEAESDAMEGPDEYVHASSSLDNVSLEDTDWPWAHDQYRAYHV